MVKSALGRHLDRNGILATPDCRGGVFAVFAKISPVDLVEEFRLHFAPAGHQVGES